MKHSGVASGIGERLRKWRVHKKLSRKQTMKMVKVSQGSYSDLEHEKSLPSATTLTNMIKYSDLNIIWLLTGDGKMIQENQFE